MKPADFVTGLLVLVLSACGQRKPAESQSSLDSREVVCFLYHRFEDDRYPSTNTSISSFRQHLQHLKDNNFQVLTFSDAIDYLKSSKLVRKTAVITIDDGYSSFYENGLPVLKEFGFPATLFINTKTVGGAGYMGWPELEATKNSEVEIGNHSHSHDYFLNLPKNSRYEIFEGELEKSQEIIQEKLNVKPEVFAYPFGEYDLKMMEIVKDAGFKAAAAQKSGILHSGTNLMLCPRFPMSEAYAELQKFTSKAAMHALKVSTVTPESPILSAQRRQPELTVTFEPGALRIDELQCFIQGSKCEIISRASGTVRVRATESISQRRRTLYTITVPDKQGEWHWFSHLWVNPEVESLQ